MARKIAKRGQGSIYKREGFMVVRLHGWRRAAPRIMQDI